MLFVLKFCIVTDYIPSLLLSPSLPGVEITAESFMDRLDNGFLLCQLAETLQEKFRQNSGELSPPGKVFSLYYSPLFICCKHKPVKGITIQFMDARMKFSLIFFKRQTNKKMHTEKWKKSVTTDISTIPGLQIPDQKITCLSD